MPKLTAEHTPIACIVCLLTVLPAYEVIAAGIQLGDRMTVARSDAEFGLRDRDLARLSKGDRITVTEVRGVWVGGYAVADREKKLGWIHQRDLQRVAQRAGRYLVEFDRDWHVHAIRATSESVVSSDLAEWVKFERIVSVDLGDANIGGAEAAHLGKLTSLEHLYLNGTGLSDGSLKQLQELSNLEVLVLAETPITGSGLTHLKSLTSLRTLNLSGCSIRDDELEHLSDMRTLEVLTLSRIPLTGEGLSHLRNLRNLRVLNLDDSAVRDAGIVNLQGLPSLRMLYLRGTAVTDEAVDLLDEMLYSCAIYQ